MVNLKKSTLVLVMMVMIVLVVIRLIHQNLEMANNGTGLVTGPEGRIGVAMNII